VPLRERDHASHPSTIPSQNQPEATRKLQICLEEGRRTMHALHLGLREHFGPTDEALAAFGI